MSANDALQRLRYGGSINCITPEGRRFQIQSKLSHGLTWYRTRPITKGCLNHYSRLSNEDMLQWLNSVSIESVNSC